MAARPHNYRIPTLIVTAAVLATSCGVSPPYSQSQRQPLIQVVGPWSGIEQERFAQVLSRFESETGLQTTYTPAPDGVATAIADRRTKGLETDVAFLPQPGLLRQYALAGELVPLQGSAVKEVRRNYSQVWQDLGSVNGELYGVWFKAADKSLIWYNISSFETAGVVPPGSLDRLLELAARLRQSGTVPFAVGGGDAWTLTDWFENLYLTMQGPERYELLARHAIPWTDNSVVQTLQMLAQILEPGNLAGGTGGALHTSFNQSVLETFASPPAAAMVFEGDFVAGVITGDTAAQLGVDADVFRFPPQSPNSPWIIGGGDAAVALTRAPSAAELIRYLASPGAGAIWAALGGFVSPNLNVGIDVYPDEITRSIALSVLDAGDSFLFDLSDLQPAEFGATNGSGLFAELQTFLAHRDPQATASRLETEAAAAYAK
jgi:alpha-glucoside transport system substrate-binding protein